MIGPGTFYSRQNNSAYLATDFTDEYADLIGKRSCARERIEVALKLRSIVDVRDPCAQQISLAHVWTRQPFTSYRTNFQADHAAGQMQREIQPVGAAAKSFVDDRRGKDHAHAASAQIVRPPEKDKRRLTVLNIIVEQRKRCGQLDFTSHSEPAQVASFNGGDKFIQAGQSSWSGEIKTVSSSPSELFDCRGTKSEAALSGWPVVARNDKFVHERS